MTYFVPQVYDEYDEEVANVEAAEEAANCGIVLEDKDAEIKPFLPKCVLDALAALLKLALSQMGHCAAPQNDILASLF
jgi:hypothetical protein